MGTVAPLAADGQDGDFYINTATSELYGPKGGSWGTGVSLVVQQAQRVRQAQRGLTGFKRVQQGPMAQRYISNGTAIGDMKYWNGTSWSDVTGGTEGATLQFISGAPTWVAPPSGPMYVQQRLDNGESPLAIYNSDNNLLDIPMAKPMRGLNSVFFKYYKWNRFCSSSYRYTTAEWDVFFSTGIVVYGSG